MSVFELIYEYAERFTGNYRLMTVTLEEIVSPKTKILTQEQFMDEMMRCPGRFAGLMTKLRKSEFQNQNSFKIDFRGYTISLTTNTYDKSVRYTFFEICTREGSSSERRYVDGGS